jgi:hypothetical protein
MYGANAAIRALPPLREYRGSSDLINTSICLKFIDISVELSFVYVKTGHTASRTRGETAATVPWREGRVCGF